MFSLKQITVAFAISALAAPAAFATSGITPADNEIGYQTHAMPASGLTRDQVRAELEAFRRNPVSADGSRFVGGEAGWEIEGHKIAWRDGKLVHADNIDHNAPRASALVTPQSRAEFQRQYPSP